MIFEATDTRKYKIIGVIFENDIEFEGVEVKLDDKLLITDLNGQFEFVDIPFGTYTLTPNKLNYEFIPESIEVLTSQNIDTLRFEAYYKVGVKNFLEDNKIKVYRTNSNDKLKLEVDNELFLKNYKIVNLNGIEMKSGDIEELIFEIDLSNLSTGIYFLIIDDKYLVKVVNK